MADPQNEQSTFGHYGEVEHVSGNWLAALFTSSILYVLIGAAAILIGTATKRLIVEPEPVEVKFVEKVVKPEVPVEPPKPPPKMEAKPRQQAAAAAAAVPKNMKVRKLDAPPPPKVLEAPREMPLEAPAEADPAFDQGVAVYGEPGDPAGLEGGFGDGTGDIVGTFDGLPKGAVAPKPRHQNKKPEYPPAALSKKETGVVIVKCVVRADGYLDDIRIDSGAEPFRGFVERAIKRWRYDPAQYQGQAISVQHTIEFRFRLKA